MGIDNSRTHRDKVEPLPIKDVTAKCITMLKSVPFARANEGFKVSPDLLANRLIPQANESIFLKLYVTEPILKDGKLDITSTDLFPNYVGRIFEVVYEDKRQLVLVGFSNDLNVVPQTLALPFLLYIPPSPQDNPRDHRKIYPHLYRKTADKDVPLFYQNDVGYPYAWDWLYFQCFSNMYRLSYQLKKSNKPYVFVVPLVRSFSDGIGLLNDGTLLERCLVGIQKLYFDEKMGVDNYILYDVRRIALASFSIGDSILSNFILRNRETSLFRDKIEHLIVLDPPFGNPKNRSPIIHTIISVMRASKNKSVFLYTQDAYYIQPLINTFLTPKGIAFDLSQQKIFSDPNLKNVFFAYLEPKLFKEGIQDPQLKGVHNTFPNLFINNAIARNSLEFRMVDGRRQPMFSFLERAP
ncbi:MAG: hypothetical protein KDE31_00275 [Caldilineaceae bacterium]|nr:hypothetical protein [Caldilineaceae bacterium]